MDGVPRRTRTEAMRRYDAFVRRVADERLAALRLVLRREWRELRKARDQQDDAGEG